ncbi:hypothetical protein JCM31739_09670 [Faecalimonas canis]
MRCSHCGSEMKIKNVKVDTDIYGNPIYNKYAYCYNCKIKRNLGQQKTIAKRSNRSSSYRAKKQRKTKILIAILLIILILIGICAFFFIKHFNQSHAQNENIGSTMVGKNKISSNALEQLETGMTYSEIKDIIGNEGNKLLQVSSDERSATRYQWTTKNGEGTVLLSFEDEKLISISQTGMKSNASVSLSEHMKKELKFDMSYDEIVELLGEKGVLLSETLQDGFTNKLYMWEDSNSKKSFSAVFVDDKLRSYNFNDKKLNK